MATELNYTSAAQVSNMISGRMRKLMGFSRKKRPNLPKVDPLFLFNVSSREYRWREPGFDWYRIPACAVGQDYGEPCEVPGLVIEEVLKVEETELNTYNGEEICLAIMHAGPGMRPDSDLRNFGVFVSRTNPPSHADVEEAHARMLKTCDELVSDGDRIHAEGQGKGLGGQMITDLHRWAAKEARQERNWSKGLVQMIECPACHRPVAKGSAVHLPWSECGAILDEAKAIKFGLIRPEAQKPRQQVHAKAE